MPGGGGGRWGQVRALATTAVVEGYVEGLLLGRRCHTTQHTVPVTIGCEAQTWHQVQGAAPMARVALLLFVFAVTSAALKARVCFDKTGKGECRVPYLHPEGGTPVG